VSCHQGDQIVRIFAHWAIVDFGQLNENYRSNANSQATKFQSTSYEVTLLKNVLASFWATFSQAHLVTLLAMKEVGNY
jgi:hypothetical protein